MNTSAPRIPAWLMSVLALSMGGVLVITTHRVCEPTDAISPDHAAMHFNLGKYERLSGQPEKAVESLKRALANQPCSFGTLSELGNAFMRLGDKAEARKQFEAALVIEPAHAESHCNLGNLLLGEGRIAEACDHYRKTLETEPREISALNNLAWVMATSANESLRDGKQAVEHAERVAEVTERKQPVILMTLGAAYAADGRFQDAIATAEAGLRLADETANEALARTLRAQLELYRSGKPVRDGSR